jgi:hypothetical protein
MPPTGLALVGAVVAAREKLVRRVVPCRSAADVPVLDFILTAGLTTTPSPISGYTDVPRNAYLRVPLSDRYFSIVELSPHCLARSHVAMFPGCV